MKRVIETNAFNFYNRAQTGVDPMTGQFFLNYPLLSVVGNDLKGPGISLVLSYSPFTTEDFFGFGKGVSITGVSIYHGESSRVGLRDGSNWSVDAHGKMNSLKTKAYKFKHADENKLIFHKDGSSEVLAKYVVNETNYYVTKYIFSAQGDWIKLIWGNSGKLLRLQSVADQTGNILAELYYKGSDTENKLLEESDITLKMYPCNAAPCQDPEESYQIGYKLGGNGCLSHIVSTDKDKGNRIELLKIGYEEISGLNYISNLDYLFGKKVKIAYKKEAFTYNKGKSGEIKLAGVERLETTGVLNQADRVVSYTYSTTNFLGEGDAKTPSISTSLSSAEGKRKKRSIDLMYQAPQTYTYGSTTTIRTGKGEIITTRTYNNFHQLIVEETKNHDNIVRKEIECHSLPEKPIEDQPENFMYPHKTTVTYKKEGKAPRIEPTITQYDDHGDLESIIYPNGHKEVFSWAAPTPTFSSETDKDKNLGNIVRFLEKKESFVVDRSGKAEAQKLIKDTSQQFSYKQIAIKPIKLDESYMLPIFVCEKESNFKNDKQLNSTAITYDTNTALNSPYLGRVKQIKETLHDTTGGGAGPFVTIKDIEYETRDSRLITTIKQTATNQIESTPTPAPLPPILKQELSVLTGAMLKETNASGITTEYKYDYLGRLKEQIYAISTDYSHTKTWVYETQTDRLQITEEDGLGNKSRTSLNGDGHVIETHFYDLDISKQWHQVYDCSYDVLGRKVAETAYDYTQEDLRNKNEESSIKKATKYEYDDRNNKVIQINADGTKSITETDPIGLTKTSYKESTNGNKSGIVVTKFDPETLRQTEIQIKENYDKDDVFNHISYSYDNLGRVIKTKTKKEKGIIMQDVTTAFEYDVYNRVTKEILPDDSVIERKYAGHLTTSQVTSIGVKKTTKEEDKLQELGTRKYDGLGRLIENSVGGRVTSYVYNANNYSFSPDKVVLPSENSLEYSYIKELGQKVSGVIGKDKEGNERLKKIFEYDQKSYNMKSHQEGKYKTNYTYYPSGKLKTKKSENNPTMSQSYDWSLGGLPLGGLIVGVKNEYHWHANGRLSAIIDGDAKTDLAYDKFGRVNKLTFSIKGSTKEEINLTYNKLNQETQREIIFADYYKVVIMQKFGRRGELLKKRTVYAERGFFSGFERKYMKEEDYNYDKLNRLTFYSLSSYMGRREGEDCYDEEKLKEIIKAFYPKASSGSLYIQQEVYAYDHFNNITKVVTETSDFSRRKSSSCSFESNKNTATYKYENKNDPTQLSSVENNVLHPNKIELKYDSEGRMIQDAGGFSLGYDVMGRLITYGDNDDATTYHYNALDELIQYNDTTLYYNGNKLVSRKTDENDSIRYINDVAIKTNDDFTLIAKDQNGSVIAAFDSDKKEIKFHNYTPYGYTDLKDLDLGYNGELIDGEGGVYHLGKGYRAYNPILRRFTCPDSMSPFDEGGINPYAYCNNNPVMYTDPSGHLSGWAWTSIGLGVAGLGLAALTIATGGASLGLAGAILLTLDVNASILGIASGALEKSNPKASEYLGYGALATGGPGLVRDVIKLPKAVKAGISWVKGRYGANAPIAFYHSASMYTGETGLELEHIVSRPGNSKLVVVGHGGHEIRFGYGGTEMIPAGEGRTVHFHTPRGYILKATPLEISHGMRGTPVESIEAPGFFENRWIEAANDGRSPASDYINSLHTYRPEVFNQMEHDFLIVKSGKTELYNLLKNNVPGFESLEATNGNTVHYSDIHMVMCRANVATAPRHIFRNRLPS
nr:RHS repeat-associated core domain-containing protein [Elizabethkingia sp. ASV34]